MVQRNCICVVDGMLLRAYGHNCTLVVMDGFLRFLLREKPNKRTKKTQDEKQGRKLKRDKWRFCGICKTKWSVALLRRPAFVES